MSTKDIAISIKDLKYSYKSEWLGPSVEALKGFSLDVYQGDSFGFLGHNGAGKTTTIKLLLGLTNITSGSMKIFDKDPQDPEARRSVGYLPEQPYFYDHLTVREMMEMYAALAGVPKETRSLAINTALDRVKISARSKSSMRSLSKGLTQRVAMAQAIVGDPRLLVLDEPFSGLDPIGRREFADLLFGLNEEGTTIFMSSHILSDVEHICNRASILARGELKGVYDLDKIPTLTKGSYQLQLVCGTELAKRIEKGSVEAGSHGEQFRFTYAQQELAEKALQLAISEGAKVERYQFIQGSLEELFIQLVDYQEAESK